MDRLTNVNKDYHYATNLRSRSAAISIKKARDAQMMGKWIAEECIAMRMNDDKYGLYEEIGEVLQSEYGAWEYVNCGSSQTAYGVDWTMHDEEVVGNWAGWYYLSMQGYRVPATPDYDAICEMIGRAGEDIAAEIYHVVIDSVEYVKKHGVQV